MGAHGGGELWTNGMRIVCERKVPGLRPGSEPFDLAKDKLREANLEQPSVALVIVRFAHNYTLEEKVHAVNFKESGAFPGCVPGAARGQPCVKNCCANPAPSTCISTSGTPSPNAADGCNRRIGNPKYDNL